MNFFAKCITLALLAMSAVAVVILFNRARHKQRTPPTDMSTVSFGSIFTDHMFVMEWDEQSGWHNARIQAYQPFVLDPSSMHMHYGVEIFEGMKAYKNKSCEVRLFRPRENFERMNRSAHRMCMPEVDVDFVLNQLKELVVHDKRWIPTDAGTSLYIRPTMIATEETVNLKPANKFLFFIIMSPVGAIYKEGFNPTSILVSEKYTRSSVGGVGDAKTGGNYAASMLAQKEAKEQGFSQVMWLDPIERKFVEEVGSMNIFFVINDEIVTPMLTGTILPGITRKSVLQLAPTMGLTVTERRISIDEVVAAIEDGSCTEIFGSGTAAVIAPVGTLKYKEKTYTINNNHTGPVTQKIYDTLTGIQTGTQPDPFDWVETL